MKNKQELRNWMDNLKNDLKRMRKAVNADNLDETFESFADVEHDFEMLSNQVNDIEIARLLRRGSKVTEGPARLDSHKIALIKLVRTATNQYGQKLMAQPNSGWEPDACMGLAEAKELVEKFIAEGGL